MGKIIQFTKHSNMELDNTEEKREINNLYHKDVIEAFNVGFKIATGESKEGPAPKAISMATVLVLENGDVMTHYCGARFPFQFTGALEWLKHRINSHNMSNYCPWMDEED